MSNVGALALASVNARAAGADNTLCIESDLFISVVGSFDFIVANPPYLVDKASRIYRHGGGQRGEGLSLRIVQGALAHLAPGGQLVLYTGSVIVGGRDFLREEVASMLVGTGWKWTYREGGSGCVWR